MSDDRNMLFINWADNVLQRILQEMVTQEIDPFNPDYSGDEKLRRSINYKIHNASGGNIEKITFLYEYYALFVEYGLGRGESYDRSKLNAPFKSGTKYAYKKPGIRAPKPFLFSLMNQRVFSLQKLTEHVLTENITAVIVQSLSAKEEKSQQSLLSAKNKFWKRYAKLKGRDY